MEDNTRSDFGAIDVSNALRIDRPSLGHDVSVAIFRLLRLVVLEDLFGPAAAGQAYLAGFKLGTQLGVQSLEQFLELCSQLKIGIVKVDAHDTHMKVDIRECVTCAGMVPVGRPVCSFEGGLIAGMVSSILHVQARAREVTCIGGLGDETCGFEVTVIP